MKKGNLILSVLLCFSLIFSSWMASPIIISASTVMNEDSVDQTYINSESLQDYYTANRNNQDPIILVHGLFGWGNDEVLGLNYWGGHSSLREMLENEGYTVYTPSVGPVASVWDRACELYTYLVGGTVDYGKAHSEKYGHARYGRTYEGVCPELLTNTQKIHLLGHSMGGQTVRVLAQLLEQGDADEIAATGDATSPLFQGDHHWIRSITTLATPHNGSQYDELCMDFDPVFHDMYALFAVQTGSELSQINLDFQLDQWGLKQNSGESYASYLKRVTESSIWGNTKDLSSWDLSLEGAKELNSWVTTQDDIYYFSISCCDTHKSIITNHQIPNSNMNTLLFKSSLIMGAFTQSTPGKVQVNSNWWANDGIVSVYSAIAPREGSTDTWRTFDGNFVPGTWNYLGQIENTDHIDVVGQNDETTQGDLQKLFRNIANMISSL